MLPDLNRLNVFYLVYTHLSITEAADKLHINPSAISQQLKKLEGELQITLFTSLHKRLVPTSNGKRLFSIVEPLIQSLNDNIQALENRRMEPSGILQIGAPVEFGSIYLPHVISTFRNRYDNVTFDLELGRPSSLLPKVAKGDLDVAFVETFLSRS